MIEIYLLSVTALRCKDLYEQACLKLDSQRLQKVKQAKRTEDKILRMGAGLLLQYAMKKQLEDTAKESPVFAYNAESLCCKQVSLEEVLSAVREPLEFAFRYGSHGKPYFEQYPELFFSLSHSGEYVLCAISDREIGADIQKIPETDLKRVKRENTIIEKFFSDGEKAWCQGGEAQHRERFYKIWAAKEAYMKLTGKGLAQGFDSFEVDLEKAKVKEQERAEKKCVVYEVKAPKEYAIAISMREE
ncbi:MAG: 4'-phosphopantetheinyl transferase superfamily protein [Lachnospiraceae bacterium]|nr:4'-phosphopantetheinyl transferase superfamily protein [Lachnospiraceae bacterium]